MTANSAPGFAQHPGYQVSVKPFPRSLTVCVAGHEIAHTRAAVEVPETRHAPVLYLPRTDIDNDSLVRRSAHSTYCPFKGHASYWNVVAAGQHIGNAAWVYVAPYDEIANLTRYIAFYANKVDVAVVD